MYHQQIPSFLKYVSRQSFDGKIWMITKSMKKTLDELLHAARIAVSLNIHSLSLCINTADTYWLQWCWNCVTIINTLKKYLIYDPWSALKLNWNGNFLAKWTFLTSIFIFCFFSFFFCFHVKSNEMIKEGETDNRQKQTMAWKEWERVKNGAKRHSSTNPKTKAILQLNKWHTMHNITPHSWHWWFLLFVSLLYQDLMGFVRFFLHIFSIILCGIGKTLKRRENLKLSALITFYLFDGCATLTTTIASVSFAHIAVLVILSVLSICWIWFFSFGSWIWCFESK